MSCQLCNDTGWMPIERDGVRSVARCECWRRRVADQHLMAARIPERYKGCTLDNLKAYNPSLSRAVQQARRFAENFPVVEQGLLLLGLAGVGKTHLAVGVLKAVVARTGARALFYDTRELLRVIRASYDPIARTSESAVVQPVLDAEILVLDDLGAEKTSEWVEETMNLIVSKRYNERRTTIFTSNYMDIPDIDEPNSLLGRIGFRMRSRLHEMCAIVEIDAADYRDKPHNATDEDLVTLWKLRSKTLPVRSPRQAKAHLRDGRGDLKWPGGRAGS